MASGLCGRNVGVHTEGGTRVEEQLLRESDVLGLLCLKSLQDHPGFSEGESVMVLPDVTSGEAPAPGWRTERLGSSQLCKYHSRS